MIITTNNNHEIDTNKLDDIQSQYLEKLQELTQFCQQHNLPFLLSAVTKRGPIMFFHTKDSKSIGDLFFAMDNWCVEYKMPIAVIDTRDGRRFNDWAVKKDNKE